MIFPDKINVVISEEDVKSNNPLLAAINKKYPEYKATIYNFSAYGKITLSRANKDRSYAIPKDVSYRLIIKDWSTKEFCFEKCTWNYPR